MTDTIQIGYDASAKATREAMLASGRWIMGPWYWPQAIVGMIITTLIGLGGGALVIAIGLATTGKAGAGLPFVWVGALGAAGLFLAVQNFPIQKIARHVAQSPYSHGKQTARFDQHGMTIENAQSRWQTNWSAVENVKLGKHGLIIHISGLAFAIPIENQANPAEVIAQIERWKAAS